MSETNSNPNQPCLLSFTLDGGTALGGQVSVSLQNGVVVLVGRNGLENQLLLRVLNSYHYLLLVEVGFDKVMTLAIPKN